MNKEQFIAKEIEKNKAAFGRWYSSTKKNSANEMKLTFGEPPRNKEETLQHGNALANTGNYPVGTNECFNVGIAGGCGPECFVYLEGGCDVPDEMTPRLDAAGMEIHKRLYR